MAYRMDFFAGIESKVLAAIKASKVQYPAYVFVRDDVESKTGRLAFVDQNNVLRYIRGENKQYVVKVDVLPEVEKGDVEVLYILNGIVYTFDGTEYRPMYKDNTEKLEALTERIESLESADTLMSEKIANLEAENATMAEQIAELEDKIETLDVEEKPEELYEKVKYEITSTPTGTLIDYREKEIRVMCPEDTTFVFQTSGEGADSNKYYIGMKAYAPEDAVGFKEDLAEKIYDEKMYSFEGNAFAGVDELGRKYSIVWLPVAANDNGVWSYYGKNSTTKHYIGWYYSVEWYNADGLMIASDKIRVNLSNEECHSAIEPFYIGELVAEVDALKEANTEVMEQIKTVTEQMVDFEERIIEIEKESFTFIELE